jgi:hypothetical protein
MKPIFAGFAIGSFFTGQYLVGLFFVGMILLDILVESRKQKPTARRNG